MALTNSSQTLDCKSKCRNHLEGLAPRPASGWTEEDIRSLVCPKARLSDTLLNKIVAFLDVQQVGPDLNQLQKHVMDLGFPDKLRASRLSPAAQNRQAIPEKKFVLIPWRLKQSANRLIMLAVCFPGFTPGQKATVAFVFDNLAGSEVPKLYESGRLAIQKTITSVVDYYGVTRQPDDEYDTSYTEWPHFQKGVDSVSLAELGAIHTICTILDDPATYLSNESDASSWPRWMSRDVREHVLSLLRKHYGSGPSLTPKSGGAVKRKGTPGKMTPFQFSGAEHTYHYEKKAVYLHHKPNPMLAVLRGLKLTHTISHLNRQGRVSLPHFRQMDRSPGVVLRVESLDPSSMLVNPAQPAKAGVALLEAAAAALTALRNWHRGRNLPKTARDGHPPRPRAWMWGLRPAAHDQESTSHFQSLLLR